MSYYLNNAGAGLMSRETINAIKSHLDKEVEYGAYQAAKSSKKQMDEFYLAAARAVNATSASEIAFTDSASRGWSLIVFGSQLNPGDKIVTLSSEFGTNLITLFDYAEKIGAECQVVKCSPNGDFDIDAIEKAVKDGANMIAMSHAVAHGSIINPVYDVGEIANKYNVTFLVDGCQALGQLPVDVQKMNCDAYVTTGRKWIRGPRGTGFIYVRSRSKLRSPQLDLAGADLVLGADQRVLGLKVRDDARQFELWERSVASMLGLGVALKQLLEVGIEKISPKLIEFSNLIRRSIESNNNLVLIGKVESESGVASFYLRNPEDEESIVEKFENSGLLISTMHDWDCPLHFPAGGANIIFRLSPHYYTNEQAVNSALRIIDEI